MRKKSIVFVIIFLFFIPLIGMTCSAQDEASDYAPILYFEGEETCYPVTIDFHLENSYLYEVGESTPIDTSPISSSWRISRSAQSSAFPSMTMFVSPSGSCP